MKPLDKLDRRFNLKNGTFNLDDGTLFLRQKGKSQNQFAYLLGERTLSDKTINNFNLNIDRNRDYCYKRNIPYRHVIFPAKAIAYQDIFLQEGLKITPIYGKKHTRKSVYYPGNIVEPIDYFKNDSHCSFLGQYKIMQEVLHGLGIDLHKFTYKTKIEQNRGDLGKMRGDAPIDLLSFDCFTEIKPELDRFNLSKALQGNTGGIFLTINQTAPIKKRILLFGDSYFQSCLKWLSHIFEEIIYLRSPYILPDVASSLSPDLILTGNAERYLVNTPNAENDVPFFINYIHSRFESRKLDEHTLSAFQNIFSGRNSISYLEWKETLRISHKKTLLNLENNHLLQLCENNNILIDRIRDTATSLEKTDMEEAYRLMSIAHKARPSGIFIRRKLQEYIL
ncbi:hypothetical protein [Microbulbifer sp. ANSA005]